MSSLSDLVTSLAKKRNLDVDASVHRGLQETFADLARKQIVDLTLTYPIAF